ncbi:hypothetical protein [Aliikangiella sp. G2MR2-5]|uniref:hypothetical protein n=1 Tax=Aliikangiella sp. G2MR2-5 TaxID=2788943 RepID=UPI0018AA5113|nr:hypothetical protein [Aliikangiella sp. G2MR2-5]
MNYTETLDKALSFIRELDFDKALALYYQLLEEHPGDIQLIKRIYPIEKKRPHSDGFERISKRIFRLKSKQPECRQLLEQAYIDFLSAKRPLPTDDFTILGNLMIQLPFKRFKKELEKIHSIIKSQHPNHQDTPNLLMLYCERLIENSHLIEAKQELKYMMTYYAESSAGRWAINQRKLVENLIRK